MISLKNTLFTLILLASPLALHAMQAQPRNKLIGRYWYCSHALERMAERKVGVDKIEWTITHGDRWNTLIRGRYLHVSMEKHLGVVYEERTGTVITVLKSMNEEKLKRWKAKRDNATKEDIQKAKEKSIRMMQFNKEQKPLTKREVKHGSSELEID
jgi:hypothetical protein